MLNLKGVAIREFMKWRSSQVKEFKLQALDTQNVILLTLLQSAANTEIGKFYEFKYLKNYQDFKNAMPIMEYEDLKPFFERTLQGEQNVFWHEPIQWFAKSSGTTSDKSKYIPVSSSTLKTAHYKGAFDVMSQYCFLRPDSKVFKGKTLIISGSQQLWNEKSSTRVGDISAIMVYNQPTLADFLRTPPKEISLKEDFEEKLEIVARTSIHEQVTALGGVPTWNIVLLQKILQQTGKSHIGEIWPEMELYLHGGVNFEPYRQIFEQLLPLSKMEYFQIYNASEGFFAFQDRLGADDMLLATDHGIFYEFIPLHQLGASHPEVLSLDEVETGQQYAILITTNSGLWRYMIGDTIHFTSTKPYRIKVTGRTKFFINAFGEELIAENADYAILKAAEQTDAIVRYYTAGPKYFDHTGKGSHEWIIEFERKPEKMSLFIQLLDEYLKKSNSDYEAKRSKDLALHAPIVHVAKDQLFYHWLKSKNRIGAQTKVPKLSNDRVLLEELLGLQSKI